MTTLPGGGGNLRDSRLGGRSGRNGGLRVGGRGGLLRGGGLGLPDRGVRRRTVRGGLLSPRVGLPGGLGHRGGRGRLLVARGRPHQTGERGALVSAGDRAAQAELDQGDDRQGGQEHPGRADDRDLPVELAPGRRGLGGLLREHQRNRGGVLHGHARRRLVPGGQLVVQGPAGPVERVLIDRRPAGGHRRSQTGPGDGARHAEPRAQEGCGDRRETPGHDLRDLTGVLLLGRHVLLRCFRVDTTRFPDAS